MRVHCSVEVKPEADSSAITQNPQDDKSKQYLCTVCHKRFASKYYLKVHCKRHTGENLYSCIQCGKKFASQSSRPAIWIFIQVNTSAQNVEGVVPVIRTLQSTDEAIQERNHLNVLFAANDLQHRKPLLCTGEFTLVRDHTNITCVRMHLLTVLICTATWSFTWEISSICVVFVANNSWQHINFRDTVEFTVERNRTNVTCVRKHSVSLQIYTDTWESTREINHTSAQVRNKSFSQSSVLQLYQRRVHSSRRPYVGVDWTVSTERLLSLIGNKGDWSIVLAACSRTLVRFSRTEISVLFSTCNTALKL